MCTMQVVIYITYGLVLFDLVVKTLEIDCASEDRQLKKDSIWEESICSFRQQLDICNWTRIQACKICQPCCVFHKSTLFGKYGW